MTGEVLATAEWRRDNLRSFRTCIQMLDPDRLSNPYGEMDGPNLRGGVKRDFMGAPLGYHIRMAHPADYADANAFVWKYVPATKGLAAGNLAWDRPMVIHILEQFRPDQTRGIAAMVTALKEMKMTKNFRDITLQKAVTQAMYAATIESDLPSEAVHQMIGGTDWATQYLAGIAQYVGSAKNIHMDGVKIPHLYPGTKLNFQTGASTEGVGEDFERSLLRYLAASLGVSYEQLSKDYSNTNYSSARAAMLETWRYMQGKKRMVADRFAGIVYRLWLEEALNSGQIELPAGAPSWYEGQNADAYSSCEWIGASRGQIDELKETQAAVLRIRNNLSTYEDEMARLGKDWRQALRQRKREQDMLTKFGLVLEADNMMNAASGQVRESNNGEADKPKGTKK
jgi:lambda family phage portal protein